MAGIDIAVQVNIAAMFLQRLFLYVGICDLLAYITPLNEGIHVSET